MSQFKDKTVWITGASSGIGEALAKAFAAQSAHVILSGRRVAALEDVAKGLGADTLVLPFEATDYSSLASVVDTAWDWKGKVDILVNNAGVSQRSLAVDTSPAVYRDLIDIDLLAPIWLTQLQLPRMAEAGGAHIVAISSVAGRIGAPLRTAYCAAKHGLIGYMDALRAEVEAPHNIKVTNVLPGSVATNVSRNAMTADGSARGRSDQAIDEGDRPEDCANAILDAVSNDQRELIFARGQEFELTKLRHADPDAFFNLVAGFGAHVVEQHRQENSGG